MNIYRVVYQHYSDTRNTYRVAAGTIEKAIADAKRYAKKKHYDSTPEIVCAELESKVDVFYKS